MRVSRRTNSWTDLQHDLNFLLLYTETCSFNIKVSEVCMQSFSKIQHKGPRVVG